jgi:hypothetical protein
MQRCRHCESTMMNDETVCIACGGAVQDDKPKSDAKSKFRTFIKFFMLFTALLGLASLFFETGVSFTTCMAVTIVLFLALSSAQEMLIDREKE